VYPPFGYARGQAEVSGTILFLLFGKDARVFAGAIERGFTDRGLQESDVCNDRNLKDC
jgi:hypothetical protein